MLVPHERSVPPAGTKGERTRQRLLELAIDRFGAQGFRATSVSQIARAAGVTQAAAYAYFDNKEALFVAAVDADASELIDAARARLPDQPMSTLMPAFLGQLFSQLRDHPLTQRVLAGLEPEVLPRLLALPAVQRTTEQIGAEMRAGQERGEIRADIDLDVVAPGLEVFILSILVGTVQTGGVATARHQAGVAAAFEAMLLPPRPPADRTAGPDGSNGEAGLTGEHG